MNYDSIDKLLELFYAGETTLEEEDLLRNFFRSDQVPERLKADQIQFLMYSESQNVEPLGEEFDRKLLSKMETKPKRTIQRWMYSFSGVAAAILVVVLLWTDGFFRADKPLPGTINNPELAFAETQKALQMISSNLNQGLQPVQTASAELYRPIKQMEKMQVLSQSMRQVETFGVLNQAYQLIRPVSDVPNNNENN